MKKQIKQIRYYGVNNENNSRKDLRELLIAGSGKIFPDSIIALGIQTFPGVKFYLNNSEEPIIVGPSGIFEINLMDNCEINFLHFDEKSIDFIDAESNNAYLIIDIIYIVEE